MGQYSYSQPSSSSPESIPEEDVELNKGLMKRCHCGGLLSVEVTSGGENCGRLYYKCGMAETSGGVHDNRFWDVAATEEMLRLRKEIVQLEERLDYTYLHRMNQIEDYQRQLNDKFQKTMEDLYYTRRPLAGRVRLFGAAIRRQSRVLGKYWLVITLSLCLIMSVAYNLASVTPK